MKERPEGRPLLGADSLVLLVMLFPTLFLGRGRAYQIVLTEALAYGLTVVYLLISILGAERDTYRARRFVLSALIGVVVIVPLLAFIIMRQGDGPRLLIHDNPLQIEEATRMLVHGVNPYGQDYSKTPMGLYDRYVPPQWSSDPTALPPANWDINPALFHVVSLPFGLITAVPFYLAGTATIGWWDARMIYGVAYLVVLRLIVLMVRDREQRLTAVALVGLNPLLVPFLIEGRNDILVFSLLLGSAAAWQHDRRTLAGILLGLALSTKHVAVFLLPFWILLGWSADLPWRTRLMALTRHTVVPGVVVLAMVLPFLVWNPHAFLNDTVGYLAGTLSTSFPMTGLGAAGMAVKLGWVPNALSPFPAMLLQAVIAGPLLLVLLWWQLHGNTMRRSLTGYGLFLLVFMYFGRLYADNYLGMIALVLITASYWPAAQVQDASHILRAPVKGARSRITRQTSPEPEPV